jgi:hypothetical protein
LMYKNDWQFNQKAILLSYLTATKLFFYWLL